MIEPPYREPYVRWWERSANQLMVSLLLDYIKYVLCMGFFESNKLALHNVSYVALGPSKSCNII